MDTRSCRFFPMDTRRFSGVHLENDVRFIALPGIRYRHGEVR